MALTTVPASLSATALTLTTAAQPNITSVGTLTGLTVSGNTALTLNTSAQPNITSVGTLTSLTVSGNTAFSGFLDFPDNKGLRLGASDDLQLYHDGSNSYIYDAGDGYLVIMSNGPGIRLNKNNAEVMLDAIPDGAVTLYHNNVAKLATTTAGVNVTGTGTFSGGAANNNDDANILTLNASQHARLLVDTSSTGGHRATLALESNGNELTLSNTGSTSYLGSVGNLEIDGGNVIINKSNFSSLPAGSKLNIFGDGVTLRLDGSSATTKSILFRNVNAGNPGEVYADGSLRFRTEDASTRITFHTNSSGSNNERMRIDSSGKVTVGEIQGGADGTLAVKTNSNTHAIAIEEASGSENYQLGVDSSGGLNFYNSGATAASVVFSDNDKVGINVDKNGSSIPQKTLHVEHTAGASEGILISGASDTAGHTAGILLRAEGGEADSALRAKGAIFFERTGTYGVGKLHLANDIGADNTSATISDARLTIGTSGNVGVGTNDPKRMLQVGDNTQANAALSLQTTTSGLSRIYMGDNDSTSAEYAGMISYAHSDDSMQFFASSSEKMRIHSGGQITVGSDTTSFTDETKVMLFPSGGQGNIYNMAATNEWWIMNNLANQSGYTTKIDFRVQNSSKGYIGITGSTVIYYSNSDYRLKENYNYDFDATSLVKAMKPLEFTWKDEPMVGKQMGFLAHELKEVTPYVVQGDKDEMREDGEIRPQVVDQGKLVAVLTKALQEALVRIETLETEVTALKG